MDERGPSPDDLGSIPERPLIALIARICRSAGSPLAEAFERIGLERAALPPEDALRLIRDQEEEWSRQPGRAGPRVAGLSEAAYATIKALLDGDRGGARDHLAAFCAAIEQLHPNTYSSTENRLWQSARRRGARRDADLVKEVVKAEGWDDQTSVHPAFFGPVIGPYGSGSEEHGELFVEIEVPDGVLDEAIVSTVRELAQNIDDIHRAFGGHGVRVHTAEVTREVGVPEGMKP